MKKKRLSEFIGRQLSRLKMGLIYYTIAMSTFAALGILNIAFPEIDFWILIWLFPIVLFGAFILGYLMDKTNVVTMDYIKTLDMTNRYLNIANLRSYEFYKVMMKVMFKCGKAIQTGEPFDFEVEFDKEYKIFLKRWSPPY